MLIPNIYFIIIKKQLLTKNKLNSWNLQIKDYMYSSNNSGKWYIQNSLQFAWSWTPNKSWFMQKTEISIYLITHLAEISVF